MESFYLLLSYTDILMLRQFRPSEEVGVYFAVVKTLALVSFIHYAMAATTAHRFSEYHASGDKERLSAYIAHAIKWTFWPSVAATLILLALANPSFTREDREPLSSVAAVIVDKSPSQNFGTRNQETEKAREALVNSLKQIKGLAKKFNVSPSVFIAA